LTAFLVLGVHLRDTESTEGGLAWSAAFEERGVPLEERFTRRALHTGGIE
jgi:hypothetical protein